MPYIDWKKLKERVSLRDILDHYGLTEGLTESHRGYEGECPLCGSHAFKVNREKNAWYCFGDCKAKDAGRNGGNILDLVARKEGVPLGQAAERITGWFPEEGTERERPKKRHGAKATQQPKREEAEERAPPAHRAHDDRQPKEAPLEEQGSDGEPQPAQPPEDLSGRTNRPLPFVLQSIAVDHPALERLGFERKTLRQFGVGYFTGKGIMHEKVVFPFHDRDAQLVAYVGYDLDPGAFRYPDPKDFDPRLELYNAPLCAMAFGLDREGLVLVTDLLDVLRLYELGVHHVVALPTDRIYGPQLDILDAIGESYGKVDLVTRNPDCRPVLDALVTRFHVRLQSPHCDETEDAFLSRVAASIW